MLVSYPIMNMMETIITEDPFRRPGLLDGPDRGAETPLSEDEQAKVRKRLQRLVGDPLRRVLDDDEFTGFTRRQYKHVFRGEHQWRLADYLWSLYSHRAFHVGNMDIYLRAAGVTPPVFYPRIQDSQAAGRESISIGSRR